MPGRACAVYQGGLEGWHWSTCAAVDPTVAVEALRRFAEVCRDPELGSAARYTVAVLLEQAGTEDCDQAQAWLERQRELAIHDPKLRDLAPLSGLPNLVSLDLRETFGE